jgi:hypothetical protein
MKRFHSVKEWKSGIFENDRMIESWFAIDNKKNLQFNYFLYEGTVNFICKVLEDFPPELTTDIFVLAAHLNNHVGMGIITVFAGERYVVYRQQRELLIPLLYPGDIYQQTIRHYEISIDINAAFNRLVEEQEAPAIIIADLLKNNFSNH